MRNTIRTADAATAEKVFGLDPMVVERYARHLTPWYDKQYRVMLLGDLRDRRVLDVGCGEGDNALLLAKLGAHVTGVDVAPRAIARCMERAQAAGLANRAEFVCGPAETIALPERSFDVIWGDGVLHHVIDSLETVLERLTLWAKPGAIAVFGEPVNLAPALRRMRKLIPVKTEATDDERPLERREIELVSRFLPDMQMRHFTALARLNRFILPAGSYEHAPAIRRRLADLSAFADYVFLSVPRLASLGGHAVIWGHFAAQSGTMAAEPPVNAAIA